MPAAAINLFVAASAIVVVLLGIDLVADNTPGIPPGLRRFVDITKEENLPTAVSVLFLTATAGIAALCAITARGRGASRWESSGWAALALFFAYMAVDDAFRIHEEAATAFSRTIRKEAGTLAVTQWFLSFPSYYWQLLFLPLFGGAALFMLTFVFRRLPDRRARLFLVGGLGAYAFAVLLDFLEGSDALFWRIAQLLGPFLTVPETRHLMRAYEEAIEMIGTAAIAASMLSYAVRKDAATTATRGSRTP